jgi:hypothetical protein
LTTCTEGLETIRVTGTTAVTAPLAALPLFAQEVAGRTTDLSDCFGFCSLMGALTIDTSITRACIPRIVSPDVSSALHKQGAEVDHALSTSIGA